MAPTGHLGLRNFPDCVNPIFSPFTGALKGQCFDPKLTSVPKDGGQEYTIQAYEWAGAHLFSTPFGVFFSVKRAFFGCFHPFLKV